MDPAKDLMADELRINVTGGMIFRHMTVFDLFIYSYSTDIFLQNTFYRMKISYF